MFVAAAVVVVVVEVALVVVAAFVVLVTLAVVVALQVLARFYPNVSEERIARRQDKTEHAQRYEAGDDAEHSGPGMNGRELRARKRLSTETGRVHLVQWGENERVF